MMRTKLEATPINKQVESGTKMVIRRHLDTISKIFMTFEENQNI